MNTRARNFGQLEWLGKGVGSFFPPDYRILSSPSLKQIFQQHPRLIWVMQHGHAASWIQLMSPLMKEIIDNGGKERIPLGVVHNLFYKLPLTRKIVQYATNCPRPLNKGQCIRELREGPYTDLLVMPEGDFCNFGRPTEIRPFKGCGFIELALELDCPLLLVAHHGTNGKTLNIPLPAQVLKKLTFLKALGAYYDVALKTEQISLTPLPGPDPSITLNCQLHHLTATREILKLSQTQKYKILQHQSQIVQEKLQLMSRQAQQGHLERQMPTRPKKASKEKNILFQ